MTMTTNARTPKRKGRLGSALTSLTTILGAFATIMTAVATILGLLVHHQATQLQHATAKASTDQQQIAQQKRTIQQLQSATSPRATASGSATGAGATLSGVAHYLSNESPTVDRDGMGTGQQVIGAKSYPNTVLWGCGDTTTPNEAYDVAGSSVFTTEAGIPDNMSGATDVIATVTFTNESGQQIGQPVQVSLGHPASVHLNIKGVTQLGMSCTGRDRQTNQNADSFSVALGNAGVS